MDPLERMGVPAEHYIASKILMRENSIRSWGKGLMLGREFASPPVVN